MIFPKETSYCFLNFHMLIFEVHQFLSHIFNFKDIFPVAQCYGQKFIKNKFCQQNGNRLFKRFFHYNSARTRSVFIARGGPKPLVGRLRSGPSPKCDHISRRADKNSNANTGWGSIKALKRNSDRVAFSNPGAGNR